jgi:hypothetical protein
MCESLDLSHNDAQKNFNPIGVNGLHMADTSIWAPEGPKPEGAFTLPNLYWELKVHNGITSNT